MASHLDSTSAWYFAFTPPWLLSHWGWVDVTTTWGGGQAAVASPRPWLPLENLVPFAPAEEWAEERAGCGKTTTPKLELTLPYFVSIRQRYRALNTWKLQTRHLLCVLRKWLHLAALELLLVAGLPWSGYGALQEQGINTRLQFIPYQSTLIYFGNKVSSLAPFKCYIQI